MASMNMLRYITKSTSSNFERPACWSVSARNYWPFFSLSFFSCARIYCTPRLIPSPKGTIGSYPSLVRALLMLWYLDMELYRTCALVRLGVLPTIQNAHSKIVPIAHAVSALRCHTLDNGSRSPASCHTARAKSQKYTGSPLVMKKASPSTRSWSNGMLGSILCVARSAVRASTWPCAMLPT